MVFFIFKVPLFLWDFLEYFRSMTNFDILKLKMVCCFLRLFSYKKTIVQVQFFALSPSSVKNNMGVSKALIFLITLTFLFVKIFKNYVFLKDVVLENQFVYVFPNKSRLSKRYSCSIQSLIDSEL